MEKRKWQEGMTRVSELFGLPGDVVAGLCHMEVLGDRELFLEGHHGILSYSDEQVDINTGDAVVRVEGEHLDLCHMSDREVRVRGQITHVHFLH